PDPRRWAACERRVAGAPRVGRARTARLPARTPRRYVRRIHAVAVAFPGPRLLPTPVLPTGRGGERDRARTSGHQERPANHSPVERWAAASQLAEHRDPPDEPPQLVGVRERDATADAHILGRVLLKQVAHHPHEPGEEQPEQHLAALGELTPERARPARNAQGKCRHHAELADGEERDE